MMGESRDVAIECRIQRDFNRNRTSFGRNFGLVFPFFSSLRRRRMKIHAYIYFDFEFY